MKTTKILLFAFGSLLYVSDAFGGGYKYQPLVREGVEWHYLYCNRAPVDGMYTYTETDVYFRFDGTETINGKTYSVLYRYTTDYKKSEAQIAAYMREDGEKVWSICKLNYRGDQNDSDNEFLAYDFDTPATDCAAQNLSTQFVEVNGVEHEAIKSGNHDWAIDGIGMAVETDCWGYLAMPDFTLPSITFYDGMLLKDLKETESGKYIYQHDNYYASVDSPVSQASQISIDVNSGVLYVKGISRCKNISVYDLAGKTVVSGNSDLVVVSSLKSGLYVVKITTDSEKVYTQKVEIR